MDETEKEEREKKKKEKEHTRKKKKKRIDTWPPKHRPKSFGTSSL